MFLHGFSVSFTVFKDKNTPSPFVETFPEDDGEAARGALPDHIYMDAMGFGMGNCCLQVKSLLLSLICIENIQVMWLTSDQCCPPGDLPGLQHQRGALPL